MASSAVNGDELIATFGGGDQPHAEQSNRMAGIDYTFYHYQRSQRQIISLGASYNRLRCRSDGKEQSMDAWSLYPQLTLYPSTKWGTVKPQFFVRALGPTYISDNRLCQRQQENHFTFQAQVGVAIEWGEQEQWLATLSWKHFSNANLFDDNDGIDVPLTLGIGRRW